MKKIISLAMCLVLGSFVLAGCSNNSEPFEEKATRWIPRSVKSAWMYRTELIDVSLSEDDQIHIQYSENSKEYYEISVSDEHVLTMTSASDKEGKNRLRWGQKPLLNTASYRCRCRTH